MQTEAAAHVNAPVLVKLDCMIQLLRGNLLSVRGYGLRTGKPRQGRNAATAV
jgi:hypothetical protein